MDRSRPPSRGAGRKTAAIGSRETIADFLGQRRVAIVGVSRDERAFSRAVMRELQKRGYDIVPVHPVADEIAGLPVFRRVQEIAPPAQAVLVMTAAERSAAVVRDCLAAGVRRVWLHRGGGAGAVSEEAVALCTEADVELVAGYCPLMFLPRAGLPHALHGAVLRLLGRYPQ
ncbi:MAG: CoA-binding protein [Acidobacteriota bacterium]